MSNQNEKTMVNCGEILTNPGSIVWWLLGRGLEFKYDQICTMYDHHSMNVGDNILKTFIPHDQIGDTCIL